MLTVGGTHRLELRQDHVVYHVRVFFDKLLKPPYLEDYVPELGLPLVKEFVFFLARKS